MEDQAVSNSITFSRLFKQCIPCKKEDEHQEVKAEPKGKNLLPVLPVGDLFANAQKQLPKAQALAFIAKENPRLAAVLTKIGVSGMSGNIKLQDLERDDLLLIANNLSLLNSSGLLKAIKGDVNSPIYNAYLKVYEKKPELAQSMIKIAAVILTSKNIQEENIERKDLKLIIDNVQVLHETGFLSTLGKDINNPIYNSFLDLRNQNDETADKILRVAAVLLTSKDLPKDIEDGVLDRKDLLFIVRNMDYIQNAKLLTSIKNFLQDREIETPGLTEFLQMRGKDPEFANTLLRTAAILATSSDIKEDIKINKDDLMIIVQNIDKLEDSQLINVLQVQLKYQEDKNPQIKKVSNIINAFLQLRKINKELADKLVNITMRAITKEKFGINDLSNNEILLLGNNMSLLTQEGGLMDAIGDDLPSDVKKMIDLYKNNPGISKSILNVANTCPFTMDCGRFAYNRPIISTASAVVGSALGIALLGFLGLSSWIAIPLGLVLGAMGGLALAAGMEKPLYDCFKFAYENPLLAAGCGVMGAALGDHMLNLSNVLIALVPIVQPNQQANNENKAPAPKENKTDTFISLIPDKVKTQLDCLINKLANDDFDEREKATERLAEYLELAKNTNEDLHHKLIDYVNSQGKKHKDINVRNIISGDHRISLAMYTKEDDLRDSLDSLDRKYGSENKLFTKLLSDESSEILSKIVDLYGKQGIEDIGVLVENKKLKNETIFLYLSKSSLTSSSTLEFLAKYGNSSVRNFVTRNENTDAATLNLLARDKDSAISIMFAAIKTQIQKLTCSYLKMMIIQ